MEIPTFIFFGAIAAVAIVMAILSSQRKAAAGFAEVAKARTAWERQRVSVAEHLEPEAYRTPDDGGKRLTSLAGHVGRIVATQRPRWAGRAAPTLPDADVHAIAELVNAHQQVMQRGMLVEARLRTVVESRVRTSEERRIMTRAFRRWVLGWSEEAITRLLVDPKVSVKRRQAAAEAVSAGIALTDDRGELGNLTERFVESLERAEAAYLDARELVRPS